MYSVEHDFRSGVASIVRDRDGARIPQDPRNKDFAEFLAWNAKRPDPLDVTDREPPPPPPPVKDRNILAEIYLATDLETRTGVWNDFVGALILDWVNVNPDAAQAILDARGIGVKIRGGD